METTDAIPPVFFKLFGFHEMKLCLMSLSAFVHILFLFIFLSVPGTFGVGIPFGLVVWIERFLKEIGIRVFQRYPDKESI